MSAEWPIVSLGEVLKPVRRPVPIDAGTEYRIVGIRWYGNGAFLKDSKSGSKIAAKRLNAVEPGDVSYSKLFAWKGSFAVIPEDCRGAVASSEFPTYVADVGQLLPEYFALWAAREEVWDAANDLSTGTTAGSRNRLAPEEFLELEIKLPPINRQRAIVEAERRIRGSGSQCRSVGLALGKTYRALVDLEIDGPILPLSEILEGIEAGSSPKCLPRAPREGEFGVLKTAAIRHGSFRPEEAKALPTHIDPLDRHRVIPGDLLTIRASGSQRLVGALCRVPSGVNPRLLMSDYVWRLRPSDRVDPDYLVHATVQKDVRAQIDEAIAGSTSAGKISRERFLTVGVPVPAAAVQRRVVERLSALWGVMQANATEANAVERLRGALIEEIVSGTRAVPIGEVQ